MTLWTAADAARATGGRATSDWAASGVSIDTRSLQPGDLFVALTDARDGHDFVADALAKGAAAALVSRVPEGVADDAPLLIVDEVLPALERLGAAGRARTRARVVGVTGSVGKTSTKEMLRAALGALGAVHAAEKSFNNHWGVPLTLARMPADADFAVIEIGMNHPGEIAPLSRLARPHVALITTVAPAHLEAFDSVAAIAREKAAIFDGLEPGGVAVVNGDIPTAPILVDAARAKRAAVRTFGEARRNFHRVMEVRLSRETTVAQGRLWRQKVTYKVRTPGRHFAVNALAVLGVVKALKGDVALAIGALGRWEPAEGRGKIEMLSMDAVEPSMSVELIDDAFNANPASMAAALEILAATEPRHGVGRISRGRRIAVLGDMLELGAGETALHSAIAELPSMGAVDVVHCVGPRMRALHEALPEERRGQWVETADALATEARGLFDAGDVLLVKGSKGSKVSRVVDAIRKLGHPLLTELEGLS
ncbi:UDP-N-acetylmuramoyl-tripeptide--D-alanyl-D-alanine ligase [Psychromarinibacter sp. C21-152]|uniref:UDP-N-acetylmuramoyl-tripeptide--D-alanyl-D-alanine ligase n=1 Tax=Psychromarinibacter sediminicola TaxID=3033385 RepID=A0AAE3NPP7_9RHOB|nr:UDP-N-acetylmuramoyl-tripeptide--D-alanyl-D-alanine ligase [Psychromarinibacter sediminicola]MDF0599742.1 UDP-N-acetylmuramoyl-tripeptide--D-alanyl-D-alanine ligase [Psychromarinibacter sediminicola]